jgi:hypothetical protein
MVVLEPRHHEGTTDYLRLARRQAEQLRGITEGDDGIAPDGDGLHPGLGRVTGPNPAYQDGIGLGG